MLSGTELSNHQALLKEQEYLKALLKEKSAEIFQIGQKIQQNCADLNLYARRLLVLTPEPSEIMPHAQYMKLLEDKTSLAEQLAILDRDAQSIKQTLKSVQIQILQMEKSRVRREASPEAYLQDRTLMPWLQNEKRYGKGVIVSDPIEDRAYADKFVNLIRQYIDTCAKVVFSVEKQYYRVTTTVEKVLDAVVDNHFASGHQIDFTLFFQDLHDSKSSEKSKLRM